MAITTPIEIINPKSRRGAYAVAQIDTLVVPDGWEHEPPVTDPNDGTQSGDTVADTDLVQVGDSSAQAVTNAKTFFDLSDPVNYAQVTWRGIGHVRTPEDGTDTTSMGYAKAERQVRSDQSDPVSAEFTRWKAALTFKAVDQSTTPGAAANSSLRSWARIVFGSGEYRSSLTATWKPDQGDDGQWHIEGYLWKIQAGIFRKITEVTVVDGYDLLSHGYFTAECQTVEGEAVDMDCYCQGTSFINSFSQHLMTSTRRDATGYYQDVDRRVWTEANCKITDAEGLEIWIPSQ